jgi:hypothetical protein
VHTVAEGDERLLIVVVPHRERPRLRSAVEEAPDLVPLHVVHEDLERADPVDAAGEEIGERLSSSA